MSASNAETAVPAAAAASGGAKAWLPLVANLLVMPCVAYVLAVYVILPKLESRMGENSVKGGSGHSASSHGSAGRHEPAKEKFSVSLADKLVVNVSGSLGTRFLVARVTLVGSSAELKDLVEKHDAQLRDAASGILANKSLADLERPGARNIIKTELMTAIVPILGEGAVDEIFFSDFAVQ